MTYGPTTTVKHGDVTSNYTHQYAIPDGPLALDHLSQITDPAPRECQFEDPRTGKDCGADGTIYRVAYMDGKGGDPDPIDVCPTHLPAVIVNPPRDDSAVWAVMIAQDVV